MFARRALRLFIFLLLGGWSGLSSAVATEKEGALPLAFFEKLEQQKTPAEQDALIRSAGAAQNEAALRRQLLTRAYDLTLKGDYPRAEIDAGIALRLALSAHAEEDAAEAQIKIAFSRRESGDLNGALNAINAALAFYEAHPEIERGLISAHQARGIIYLCQSDFARALNSLQRALALSEKIKHREGIIPALNSIGEVYRTQGQPQRAVEYYERARQVVGDDAAWNMAYIFNNLGMAYAALGDFKQAIENVSRARAVAERVGFRPRVETSLAVLGDLQLQQNHLAEAEDYYTQSRKLAEELHDAPGAARAILGTATVASARGENEAALHKAQDAADRSRALGQLDQVVPALTLSGRALCALGRDEEARGAFEGAIAAVEEMRGQVAGGEVERETFFARQIEPYHELIRLLVRQKRNTEALAMAEKASARVLLDITSGGRAEMNSVLNEVERQTLRVLEAAAAAAQREGGNEARRREIERSRENFEATVEAAHPELRRTALPAPLASLAQVGPLLGGGKNALLRFVVTNDESFLFLLTRSAESSEPALEVFSLGKKRAELARLTNDFRTRLAARSVAWEKPARDFYDLLLRPVEARLHGLESLVIVPDGPLWELPFQALEKEAGHPLLIDYKIRYAPSLTLLDQPAPPAPAATPGHQLLAFVNPALRAAEKAADPRLTALLGNDWQPLPQTEKQAPALQEIYPAPGGQVFVGAEAREEVFKEKAAGSDLLHFAMHGVLDDRAPLYSYLLFSQLNLAPGEDGRLEARELINLKLHARLAVLCGCETARGQVTAGEGVIGLSWGFFVAGCPATIVSQWKVDSASSTPLMVELHRQLHDGVDNAAALRQASLELRKDARYRHPFYWAPFVLVGR